MSRTLLPVILSGGSGTRLWPLSRELHPKQFLPLVGDRTLLQQTFLRIQRIGATLRAPIVVCNEDHRFLVAEQMRLIDVSPETIVLEPVGRNTAPAVAIAAALAERDDPLLLVLPADHVIADADAFIEAVRVAMDAASAGKLVTFGVVPSKPETGYGYVLKGRPGDAAERWYRVDRFVEKPDLETARGYLESGNYLWNSGMFVFSARRYLEELERHAPDIAAACRAAVDNAAKDEDFTRLGPEFTACRSDSIDYAVMEKTADAAVVPLDCGWSDVGSWPALHEVLEKDDHGNVLRGDVLSVQCKNSYIAASRRLVAAVGVEGYVIVETADAVLVMPQQAAQDVKKVVEALKAAGRGELKAHPEGEARARA